MMIIQHPTQRRRADDPLARFFLGRLSTLAAQQATASGQERVALARAVFSTYLDCRDLGLEDDAEVVLNEELLAAVERSA
jgi:hypothetical protein